MKAYFQKKLETVVRDINGTTNSILKEVAQGNFANLTKLHEKIIKLKDRQKELTHDCVKYLTVDEVLELAKINVTKYEETVLSVFKVYDIAYAYQYESSSITLQERDKLISHFGYELKNAKV